MGSLDTAQGLGDEITGSKDKVKALSDKYNKKKDLYNRAQASAKDKQRRVDALNSTLEGVKARAEDLKKDLDATPVPESDPRFAQYKEYCDLVNNV